MQQAVALVRFLTIKSDKFNEITDHRIRIIRDEVQSIAWIKTRFFRWSLRDTGSKPDCYTFKSVREYEIERYPLSSTFFQRSFFFSFRIPRIKTIRRSVNGQLYFLSFFSTVVFRSPVPEGRRKESERSGYAVKKKEEERSRRMRPGGKGVWSMLAKIGF